MRKLSLALLALGACANKGTTHTGDAPAADGTGGTLTDVDKQQDYDDVATSIGTNLADGELEAMLDAVNMGYGRMPAGFTSTQAATYVVLDGTRGGLTVEYKLYCRDSAANPVPCDGLEYQAHVRPSYSGSITGTTMDGVQRTAAWILRNLASTPSLGGSGTNMFASHLTTGDYETTVTDTVNNVLFAATPGDPVGGALDLTLNVQRTRNTTDPAVRMFMVTAVVTFHGTDSATIALDSTHNYTMTLSTGVVAKL